jgi:SAM-dependent methyltransferase
MTIPLDDLPQTTVQSYRHRPEVIEARLAALERNSGLYADGNLAGRAMALDVIQQVYQCLRIHCNNAQWQHFQKTLGAHARALEARLRQADAQFIRQLRHDIRIGKQSATTLRRLFDRYTRYRPGRVGYMHRGYDTLDVLVQGLIRAEQAPIAVALGDSGMVPYEPTPARAILDLVDQVGLNADDVFYDVGAGLGHVAILVHLLTGAAARGVEIDAAYCQHAQYCAEELALAHVRFLHRDAREVDYADGTVFFLYTPFTGEILATVLATLAQVAHQRPLTLCTYGACTFDVVQQPWLRLHHAEAVHPYALAVFTSL